MFSVWNYKIATSVFKKKQHYLSHFVFFLEYKIKIGYNFLQVFESCAIMY